MQRVILSASLLAMSNWVKSIEAKARITPLDLAESENARTNLMVFLQSLDANGDHSDGIEISAETQAAFKRCKSKF